MPISVDRGPKYTVITESVPSESGVIPNNDIVERVYIRDREYRDFAVEETTSEGKTNVYKFGNTYEYYEGVEKLPGVLKYDSAERSFRIEEVNARCIPCSYCVGLTNGLLNKERELMLDSSRFYSGNLISEYATGITTYTDGKVKATIKDRQIKYPDSSSNHTYDYAENQVRYEKTSR